MSPGWAAAIVALWLTVLVFGIVLLGLLKRVVPAIERAETFASGAAGAVMGLPVGSEVGDFRAIVNGERTGARELLTQPTVVLFLEANCAPCKTLASDLEGMTDRVGDLALLVVLAEENGVPEWLPLGLRVAFERNGEVTRAFANAATPQAYVVDERRFVLARGFVGSRESIVQLAGPLATKGGDVEDDRVVTHVPVSNRY